MVVAEWALNRGHFHDNWSNDNFRKVILNSFYACQEVDVPEGGVQSSVTADEINANLDPKASNMLKTTLLHPDILSSLCESWPSLQNFDR